MGYMMAMGRCVACKAPLSFNPNLVPSIRVNGEREPVCRACVARWEEIHGQKMSVHPNAYGPEEVA